MPSNAKGAAGRERQRRGQTARADEGGYMGGPIPYGLRLDEWGRWVQHRRERDTLRTLLDARRDGVSLNGLVKLLTDVLQVSAPRGGRWTPSTILKMLHNPIYYRRVADIPPHLEGDARKRAEYNFATTGILAGSDRSGDVPTWGSPPTLPIDDDPEL